MDPIRFRSVVDVLLLIVLTVILGLFIYSWTSQTPTRTDLQQQLFRIEDQLIILTCQMDANDDIERAACQISGGLTDEPRLIMR